MKSPTLNSIGMSLVELLIAVAIVSFVGLAFATMMQNQNRETQALSQKLAAMDVQRSITNLLASAPICSYIVTNPPPTTFNPVSGLPVFAPITKIYSTPAPNSQSTPLVDLINPASPLSTLLFIKSIGITDFTCPPPCTASTNQFTANLTLTFDNTKLVRSLSPIKFPITITSTTVGGLQKISGCGASGSSGTSLQDICTSMKGTWNASTNTCSIANTCNSQTAPKPDGTCDYYMQQDSGGNGYTVPGISICTPVGWTCMQPGSHTYSSQGG